MARANWWTQSITGDDNRTIDRPLLFVTVAVFGILPAMLVVMIGLTVFDMMMNKASFGPAAFGGGVAAVLAGIAAYVTSMLLLLKQDRAPTPIQASSTTTTTDSTTTTVHAAAPVVAMQPGVEPLSPKIGPEDVGKSVAIVPPTKKGKRK